jgi:hypothetical protein
METFDPRNGKVELLSRQLYMDYCQGALFGTRVARWFLSNQKSQFGKILEGLRLENVVIFYGHLEFFTDIWDIL